MPELDGSKTHDNLKDSVRRREPGEPPVPLLRPEGRRRGLPGRRRAVPLGRGGRDRPRLRSLRLPRRGRRPRDGRPRRPDDRQPQVGDRGRDLRVHRDVPGLRQDGPRRGLRRDRGVARDARPGREEPRRPLHPGPREASARPSSTPSRRPRATPGAVAADAALHAVPGRPAYGLARTTMRKLTHADIKDLREYERERDAFRAEIIAIEEEAPHPARRPHDDRVRERRRRCASRSRRWRAPSACSATSRSPTSSRPTTSSSPTTVSSRGTLFIEITDAEALRVLAADASPASTTTSQIVVGGEHASGVEPRTSSASPARRTSPPPSTTCKFAFTADQQRGLRRRPGAARRRPPRVPGRRRRSPTSSATSSSATSPLERCRSPHQPGSTRACPCPAQAHDDDAGYDLSARDERRPRGRRRSGPRPDGRRRRDPAGLRRARPAPLRAGAATTA